MLDSNSYKDYPWREVSYHSFYQAADNVVEDIQSLVWVATDLRPKNSSKMM